MAKISLATRTADIPAQALESNNDEAQTLLTCATEHNKSTTINARVREKPQVGAEINDNKVNNRCGIYLFHLYPERMLFSFSLKSNSFLSIVCSRHILLHNPHSTTSQRNHLNRKECNHLPIYDHVDRSEAKCNDATISVNNENVEEIGTDEVGLRKSKRKFTLPSRVDKIYNYEHVGTCHKPKKNFDIPDDKAALSTLKFSKHSLLDAHSTKDEMEQKEGAPC